MKLLHIAYLFYERIVLTFHRNLVNKIDGTPSYFYLKDCEVSLNKT
jgi:hypothetical protein